MKAYLTVKQRPSGKELVLAANDFFRKEADRWFRQAVIAGVPAGWDAGADLFFKGTHSFDLTNRAIRAHVLGTTAMERAGSLSATGEIPRHRFKGSFFFDDFPDSGTRIAFAFGRVYVRERPSGSPPSPDGLLSVRDFGLQEIGNTHGHPVGRRAFFPETGIPVIGLGAMDIGGTLALAADEKGHSIYSVVISQSGDDGSVGPAGKFFFRRRPYWLGAYEAGAGETDFFTSSASDTLATRFKISEGRATLDWDDIIPDSSAPVPAEVPYSLDYPTAVTATNRSIVTGMIEDGGDPSHLWYCFCNAVAANHADVIKSRSIWRLPRMAGVPPVRMDAADGFADDSISGFPTLSTSAQYRDLEMARGGYAFAALDADDDDNNGANEGGLIQIDTTTGIESIVAVIGEVASTPVWGTTYTQGGLFQYNVLGIAIDKSESFAAAGSDRIWVLHRNGLSFADMVVATGVLGAWTTVATAGAGLNTLTTGSTRGISGYTWDTSSPPVRNANTTPIDVDSSGAIYFLTTNGAVYDAGNQRLNRLTGDGATHTFYTIGPAEEAGPPAGSQGFIDLGRIKNATTHIVGGFKIHRRDAGDPLADDIWLTGGYVSTGSGPNERAVHRLPVDEFAGAAQANPGASWFGNKISANISNVTIGLQVAPDGQVVINHPQAGLIGFLETFGQENAFSGTIDKFDLPAAGIQTIHRDTGAGDQFSAEMVGKRVVTALGTSSANRGSFVVDAFTDIDTIDIRNSGGASTAIGEGASYDSNGTEFSLATGSAALFNGCMGYDPYVDGSGWGWYIEGCNSSTAQLPHVLNCQLQITYQWSGSVWYRSRVAHVEAVQNADGLGGGVRGDRDLTTSALALNSGVTAQATNQNAGVGEFVVSEYYTAMASEGIIKEPAQELTYNIDFYQEKTELIDESSIDKTCVDQTAVAAFRNTENLGTFPPVSTALAFTETDGLAYYQRTLELDGTVNTPSVIATGNMDTNLGFTVGLDLGSSLVIERLLCALGEESFAALYADMIVDLYSSNDNVTYELRSSFVFAADHPEWMFNLDAFHLTTNFAVSHSNAGQRNEVEVDLAALEANAAFLGATSTNVAQRYWKLVFRASAAHSAPVFPMAGGIVGYLAGGAPAGVQSDRFIGTANDSNYVANYIKRIVFLQDSGAANATITLGTTVTLPGGSAPNEFENIAVNDFFRNTGNGEESKITDISGLPTVIVTAGGLTNLSGQTWEVVRNADVRPRDDEGGGEDVPRFPSVAGEIFVCPVTGHLVFHASDISGARTFRIDEYVKVLRAL